MNTIGILGGGQLGRMTMEEAQALLCRIEVLSPDYPAPAADLAAGTLVGDLMDREAVLELAGLYGSDFALAGVPLDDGVSLVVGAVLLGYIGAWLAVARHLNELAPR